MLTIKGTMAEISRLCCEDIIMRPIEYKTGDMVRILGEEARLEIVEEEPDWVKRMREEHEDLEVKREKLRDDFDAMCEVASDTEIYYLEQQSITMARYIQILEKRAELKGYKL